MKYKSHQAEVNIGMVGHVDHGKTTITYALTKKWADTHSEELKRGITIKLGYADAEIRQCKKCGRYTTEKKCPYCGGETEFKRKIAIVDAPGHETLVTVMLSGAALMDGAILVIAANESVPQPQTYEHLMALNIMGIKNVIIVQNKIDLVTKEKALENYKQIKEFVKGTVAENAPIIPMAANHKVNLDKLIEAIERYIPTPERDLTKDPLMYVVRSFDVNKPGTPIDKLVGGVIGGSIIQGKIEVGDEIVLKPGYYDGSKWIPVETEVRGLSAGSTKLKEALPGGLIAIATDLDPAITKDDQMVGNVVGVKGREMPPVIEEIKLDAKLLDRVVGATKAEPIRVGEPLILTVGTAVTIGAVTKTKPLTVKLKKPVCAYPGWTAAISRKVGSRWRLVGYGKVL